MFLYKELCRLLGIAPELAVTDESLAQLIAAKIQEYEEYVARLQAELEKGRTDIEEVEKSAAERLCSASLYRELSKFLNIPCGPGVSDMDVLNEVKARFQAHEQTVTRLQLELKATQSDCVLLRREAELAHAQDEVSRLEKEVEQAKARRGLLRKS